MAALNAVVTRVKHRLFGACDAAAALLVGAAVPMRTPPLCTQNGRTSVSQPRATRQRGGDTHRRSSAATATLMGQPPQNRGYRCERCREERPQRSLRLQPLPLLVGVTVVVVLLLLQLPDDVTAVRGVWQRVGRGVRPTHAAATAALCR